MARAQMASMPTNALRANANTLAGRGTPASRSPVALSTPAAARSPMRSLNNSAFALATAGCKGKPSPSPTQPTSTPTTPVAQSGSPGSPNCKPKPVCGCPTLLVPLPSFNMPTLPNITPTNFTMTNFTMPNCTPSRLPNLFLRMPPPLTVPVAQVRRPVVNPLPRVPLALLTPLAPRINTPFVVPFQQPPVVVVQPQVPIVVVRADP